MFTVRKVKFSAVSNTAEFISNSVPFASSFQARTVRLAGPVVRNRTSVSCQCTHDQGKSIEPRSILGLTSLAPKQIYHGLNVQIEPLQINPSDLNTKRMLDLMAVSQNDGPMPLYLHTLYRILREMRIEQQEDGTAFDYQSFLSRLMDTTMSPAQLGPLNQRLDMLESFMSKAGKENVAARNGNKTSKSPFLEHKGDQ